MEKTIDWVERQALENLRFRLANAETLAKEASATLTLLLAGLAGGTAYAVKAYESMQWHPLAIGATAFSGWLVLSGIFLMRGCIMTLPLQVPTNEPDNLLLPALKIELNQARHFEMDNIQGRINATKVRNRRVALWLDRVRVMLVLSPAIFALAAAFG